MRGGAPARALAGFAVALVVLAGLEAAAAVVLRLTSPAPAAPGAGPLDAVTATLKGLDANPAPLVPDPELLWRNQPGARRTQSVNPRAYGRHDLWTLENDAQGFRAAAAQEAGAPGSPAYRILCVGDSVTFGFNVDQPDTYPRQLRELLARAHPGVRFEVVNAGVPGWSWLQGLRFLETRGLALHPDLVVIGHGTNDRALPATITDDERFDRLATPLRRGVLGLASLLSRTNLYRAAGRLLPRAAEEAASPGCRRQIRQDGACHRLSLDEIGEAVGQVVRVVRAAGTDLVVLDTDFLGTGAAGASRAAASKDGVAFVDAVAEVQRRRRAEADRIAAERGLAPAGALAVAAAPSRQVILRVVVPDSAAAYRVAARPFPASGDPLLVPLHDDGAQGDERAGDGVYSALVEVPQGTLGIEYQFYRGDEAEFTALPPMGSMPGRYLAVEAGLRAPVDVFGRSFLMVERVHPDAAGQRVVAGMVADAAGRLAGFGRAVGTGRAARD